MITAEIKERLAKLRSLRVAKQQTQAEFAEANGLQRHRVSGFESGSARNFEYLEVKRFAAGYGVSEDEIRAAV